MRQKIANLIVTVLEIGGIAGLTGIAINAEWKRHKAEQAKSEAELKYAIYKFSDYVKSITIKNLEKELEELKAERERLNGLFLLLFSILDSRTFNLN